MDNQVKVLVVRFSSIGDIVLTTPIVRCLKQQLEGDVKIHYLTKEVYRPLLKSNPYIDRIHTIQTSVKEVIQELREEQFDFIIDLHKNLRSHQLISNLKVMSFTFKKYNVEKWMLVNFGINKMPDKHLVDRYFDAVQALSIENDGKGLDYFVPKEDEVDLKTVDSRLEAPFTAMAIGGKFAGKKLPTSKLIEICKGIEGPIALLGGKEDCEAAVEITSATGGHVIDLCGRLNINQSASVVSKAKLVITHDTGLMHIAAAFKRNIISIWGATVPEFGMYPYLPGSASKIIQASHLKYRPTSKLGNRNSKKELRTMEEINVNEVIASAQEILSQS